MVGVAPGLNPNENKNRNVYNTAVIFIVFIVVLMTIEKQQSGKILF
jgi:hypothetical protein